MTLETAIKAMDIVNCAETGAVAEAWAVIKTALAELGTTPNTGSPKFSPCGECGNEESESIKLANGDNYCRRCGRKLRAGA